MKHNINAGRLRDYIEVFSKGGEQNSIGEITGETLVFDARADCSVRSSSESGKFGKPLTSTIVTILMWCDERLEPDMIVKWRGDTYNVVGRPVPDDEFKSMIATVELIS